jgi:hypothetical protein
MYHRKYDIFHQKFLIYVQVHNLQDEYDLRNKQLHDQVLNLYIIGKRIIKKLIRGKDFTDKQCSLNVNIAKHI